MKVLCVAADREGLAALKGATVSAEWELCEGATEDAEALRQIEAERPHVLIAFGPFGDLVGLVSERYPGMRIVADRDVPGATVVAASLEEARSAVKRQPRPSGPVR